MVTKKTTKARRGVKKRFYDVDVPMTSTKISLYSASVEELDGRIVKLDLTRSLRGKNLELRLRVKAVEEELKGDPISLELASSYTRKMVRKGTDYVEDSFEGECKNARVVVKPLFVTRKKVSRAVRRALRDLAKKTLLGYLKTRDSDELFNEIITNKLQRELSLKLKKIYPLALCEIRVFKILGKIDKREKAEEEKSEKKEEGDKDKEEKKKE